jgi:hypothetical protein
MDVSTNKQLQTLATIMEKKIVNFLLASIAVNQVMLLSNVGEDLM